MIEYYGNPTEPSLRLFDDSEGNRWVRNKKGDYTVVISKTKPLGMCQIHDKRTLKEIT